MSSRTMSGRATLNYSNTWTSYKRPQTHPRVRGRTMQQVGREVRQAGVNMATLFLPGLLKMDDAFLAAMLLLGATPRRWRRSVPPATRRLARFLDQLTPDLIAAVPSDPFTGDALLYRRLADGVVIYSVSTDGVDDGGAVDAMNPTLPGADLGIRLWDPAKRRQPPEPPPPRRPAEPPLIPTLAAYTNPSSAASLPRTGREAGSPVRLWPFRC